MKEENFQHKELAQGRWEELTFAEQMANIGSEVSRALNWQKKGKKEYSLKAVNRALELLELTAAEVEGLPRLKELMRVKETLPDYFYGANEYQSSEILWRKYFDHFNFCARKNC